MATAISEPGFNMFTQRTEGDEYARYPDPPHSAFPPGSLYTTMANDAYSGFPRSAHDMFSQSMCFEPALYTDAPQYAHNSCASSSTYPDDQDQRLSSSTLSTASAPSAASSTIGSPQSHNGHVGVAPDWSQPGLGIHPSIVNTDFVNGGDYQLYNGNGMEEMGFELAHPKGYVDPSLIHPEAHRPPMGMPQYEPHFHQATQGFHPASPSAASSPQLNMLRTDSSSPFMHNGPFPSTYPASPYVAPMDPTTRRPSVGNFISPVSPDYSGDESKGKGRCTYPDCGKHFKDLKAHLLTHMTERPEKCPIQTCEYHIKGFARKYDKNRHTLTHYKGTMVCGFCPGSGSSAEKSFNRADVFKRHLTTVHGVEQTPPNSRKKSSSATGVSTPRKLTGYGPEATGKCSTCSQTFANAQDFYEHLDDCVLRIVQQEEPSEAINAQRLAEVENDIEVHQTLEKNNLPTTESHPLSGQGDDDLDLDDDEAVDEAFACQEDGVATGTSPTMRKKKANPPNGVQKSRGLTHSRGGVPLMTKSRGRKNRRDYPLSWGFDKGQMTMKKRVMATFDGPRRLNKTELMLSTDQEVRIQQLKDGKAYLTDLDKLTLDRTEGFLNATEEEKGPWISDDPSDQQKQEMRGLLAASDADLQ